MTEELRGIAFTAGLDKDGWQVSVTERADSSAEAFANLEATMALMKDEGYVPFVKDYNKAFENTKPVVDPGKSVVQQAKELGGIETPLVNEYVITDEDIEHAVADISPLDDGTFYLGIKTQKPKVADCLQGQSYEIYVDSFKRPTREKIEFYNEHSKFPACIHSLKGRGGEIFTEIFPGWEPEVGAGSKMKPYLLYIVGEGETSEGNAYQNLKSAKPA